MRNSKLLGINITEDEYRWVVHAARLAGVTRQQYLKRAINDALRKQGVDAVLLKLAEDPRRPRRKSA